MCVKDPWTEGCGTHRSKMGRLPKGSLKIQVSGSPDLNWYCSSACAADALEIAWRAGEGTRPAKIEYIDRPVIVEIEPEQHDEVPYRSVPNELMMLNLLAGTHLTIMTATPERVTQALIRAFKRTIVHCDEQAERDRRGRPNFSTLLEELTG